MLLLLLVDFVNFVNFQIGIDGSLIVSIMSSLTHLHGFQLFIQKWKLKNGNLLSVHVELARLLCQIEVLLDKNINNSKIEISSF